MRFIVALSGRLGSGVMDFANILTDGLDFFGHQDLDMMACRAWSADHLVKFDANDTPIAVVQAPLGAEVADMGDETVRVAQLHGDGYERLDPETVYDFLMDSPVIFLSVMKYAQEVRESEGPDYFIDQILDNMDPEESYLVITGVRNMSELEAMATAEDTVLIPVLVRASDEVRERRSGTLPPEMSGHVQEEDLDPEMFMLTIYNDQDLEDLPLPTIQYHFVAYLHQILARMDALMNMHMAVSLLGEEPVDNLRPVGEALNPEALHGTPEDSSYTG